MTCHLPDCLLHQCPQEYLTDPEHSDPQNTVGLSASSSHVSHQEDMMAAGSDSALYGAPRSTPKSPTAKSKYSTQTSREGKADKGEKDIKKSAVAPWREKDSWDPVPGTPRGGDRRESGSSSTAATSCTSGCIQAAESVVSEVEVLWTFHAPLASSSGWFSCMLFYPFHPSFT